MRFLEAAPVSAAGFGGQRECRERRPVSGSRVREPLCFTSISPHAGLCLSLPRCVVFFRGFGGL